MHSIVSHPLQLSCHWKITSEIFIQPFQNIALVLFDMHQSSFLFYFFIFFFKHNFCVKPCVPREPRRDPSNRRLNEHGIYIRTARNRTHNLFRPKRGDDLTRPQRYLMLEISKPSRSAIPQHISHPLNTQNILTIIHCRIQTLQITANIQSC